MDSNQIQTLLSRIPSFIGVFSCDNLPTQIAIKNFSLIVNTDAFGLPGKHWQCILVKRNVCHFFDSFGGEPTNPQIRKFCEQWPVVYYNKQRHQGSNEKTCGAFCVFVINEINRGRSFRHIMSALKRIKDDDSYVRAYLLRHFHFHLSLV